MNSFAVLSGDIRQTYIDQYLRENNYHSRLKSNFNQTDDKYIICGTPFAKNEKYLNCDFYSGYPIKTFIGLLNPEQIVFGGNIPEWVLKSATDIKFVDVLKDKSVVWNNAVLTAEGLIAHIIMNTVFSICSARILIMGFGNCGTNIACRLDCLGGRVLIYDHDPKCLDKAKSLGYETCDYSELIKHMKNFDIIVNTVPQRILSESDMNLIKNSCILFDVASSPYGFDQELVKKHNLSLITCPGLPGATAPKTAGELIAKSIISYVERTEINGSQL